MNIHLGLAVALILAGVLMIGLSLAPADSHAPQPPRTGPLHGQVDSAALLGSAGQG